MIEVMSVNCHNRGTHRNHDRSPTLPLPRLHHGSFPHLTAVFDCCGRLLHCGGRPGCVDHEWPGVRRPSGKRRGAHPACRVCVSYVAPTHPTHSRVCVFARVMLYSTHSTGWASRTPRPPLVRIGSCHLSPCSPGRHLSTPPRTALVACRPATTPMCRRSRARYVGWGLVAVRGLLANGDSRLVAGLPVPECVSPCLGQRHLQAARDAVLPRWCVHRGRLQGPIRHVYVPAEPLVGALPAAAVC